MSGPKPIAHVVHVDPMKVWTLRGWGGFFLRLRGILVWVVSNSGIGWWTLISGHVLWTILIVSMTSCVTLVLFSVRYTFIAWVRCDNEFHAVCHTIRDEGAQVAGSGKCTDGSFARFDAFNTKTAQAIASFYRKRMGDATITCAIRICRTNDDGVQTYETCGRSDGADPSRDHHSQSVSANKGLPARLRSTEYRGALVVPSIAEAIARNEYERTPNDDLEDCRSMIVSPINGWNESEKVMVGILTVSSSHLDRFSEHHTTPLKAFADILGLAYPMLINRLTGRRKIRTKPHFPLDQATR